jgi:MarR family transcriptional regulator, 2-MHQ and catechol-resistance regulon repressor
MVTVGTAKREHAPGKDATASYNRAMGERYLKSVRLLSECMQGFERFSGEYVRRYGLTHGQFDIIATLGNTPGMSYKELGQRTLITKGTLTGVIERLEQKGLVARTRNSGDKRSFSVHLTHAGERLFADLFPKVVAHGLQLFAGYSEADFDEMERTLRKLRQQIADAGGALHAMPLTTEEKEEL